VRMNRRKKPLSKLRVGIDVMNHGRDGLQHKPGRKENLRVHEKKKTKVPPFGGGMSGVGRRWGAHRLKTTKPLPTKEHGKWKEGEEKALKKNQPRTEWWCTT